MRVVLRAFGVPSSAGGKIGVYVGEVIHRPKLETSVNVVLKEPVDQKDIDLLVNHPAAFVRHLTDGDSTKLVHPFRNKDHLGLVVQFISGSDQEPHHGIGIIPQRSFSKGMQRFLHKRDEQVIVDAATQHTVVRRNTGRLVHDINQKLEQGSVIFQYVQRKK
jgi:hypothetical protein